MSQQEHDEHQPVLEEHAEEDIELLGARDYDEYNLNTFEKQQRSVMSTMSRVSASVLNRDDPHIQAALELNHRFVDKNIHETLNRLK